MHDFRWAWDEVLFQYLNGGTHPFLDELALVASSRAFGLGLAAVVAIVLVARRARRAWVTVFTGAAAVSVTDLLGDHVLKPFFGRMRPCYALTGAQVRVLDLAGNNGSLPSLHSATAFAAAAVLSLTYPRWTPGFLSVAALIAWSRVREGVHWPSDVLAGAAFGLGVGSAAFACGRWWSARARPVRSTSN